MEYPIGCYITIINRSVSVWTNRSWVRFTFHASEQSFGPWECGMESVNFLIGCIIRDKLKEKQKMNYSNEDIDGLSDEAKAKMKASIQQAINPNPKIVIDAQILDGNLGDGWTDNYEAALALAKFTQEVWARDVSGYQADFEFNIDVEENTSGAAREVSVYADDWQQAQVIESVLTDPGEIWVSFCESEEAKPFFE